MHQSTLLILSFLVGQLDNFQKEVIILEGSLSSNMAAANLEKLNLLEKFYANNPDRLAYLSFRRGTIQSSLGQRIEAQASLQRALSNASPNNGWVWQISRDLGEWYLDGREAAKALPLFRRSIDSMNSTNFEGFNIRVDPAEKARIQLKALECRIVLGEEVRPDLRKVELEIEVQRELERRMKSPPPPRRWIYVEAESQLLHSELDRKENIILANDRLEATLAKLRTDSTTESDNLQFRCHMNRALNFWRLAQFEKSNKELDQAKGQISKVGIASAPANLEEFRGVAHRGMFASPRSGRA